MTTLDLLFAGFGLVAVLAGLLAVTTSRVIHAALWLVVALGALAGCFLVLGAEFIALVQVLIYVGAIVVLLPVATVLSERTATATDVMARDLFGIWVWPFELLSLLLLAALVAAFAVSRMDAASGEPATEPATHPATHPDGARGRAS